MKRERLKLFVFAIAFMAVLSCEKDVVSPNGESLGAETGADIEEVPDDPNLAAFSASLAKAFKDHEGLRTFVKERALQQFDNDYDVLYQMVKDEQVGSASFRELLLQSGISKEELQTVESEFPLLTIYVPDFSDLPEDPFSAELWNTTSQVPAVALAIGGNDTGLSIYFDNGDKIVLKLEVTPGFPVVALKINERVVISESDSQLTGKAPGKELKFHTGDQFSFSFIDKAYDGLNPSSEETEKENNSEMTAKDKIDPTLLRAYNEWANNGGIWQREHIYYDFVLGRSAGDFKTDWAEHITDIEIDPDNTLDVYKNIFTTSNDPRARGKRGPKRQRENRIWTEGKFEFYFVIALTSRGQGVGHRSAMISVEPEDVFDVVYDKVVHVELIPPPCDPFEHIRSCKKKVTSWILKDLKSKKYKLPGKGVFLWPWDLSISSSDWYLYVYEVDGNKSSLGSWSHRVGGLRHASKNIFEYSNGSNLHGRKLTRFLGNREYMYGPLEWSAPMDVDFMGWKKFVFSDPVITNITPIAIIFNTVDTEYMRVTIRPVRYK
ncbi:hypothetical protein MNBD_BACTEROID03-1050 [hydrothermal vent metagenome]|uniref:Lipoprotein n=1 Tax=hydrothermal vent metagenome TaxID=652676 RepID=A0A3B0TDY5_9ZZZZ